MKTILLISRCPPFPLHFGDRLIIWHLARQLSRRGYTIDLVAFYDRADDPDQIVEYRDFFRHIELIPEARRGGTAYLRRLFDPSLRFADAASKSFSPQFWQAISDRLERVDYDVVHCFGSVSVYEYHPLFADKPNLITPYESYALYLQSAAGQGRLGARLQLPIARRFERWMYRPYDRTVVIAEKDRQVLLSLQPMLAVDVIPNGIELEEFPWQGEGREAQTLLFVGNFEYPPNQDAARLLVDRVLPQIWRELPEAKLQLVGSNPPEWLKERADARIEVTGRVPEVQPYLAEATAFVCPLRIGAGLKNKLLEALAMGIPVVGTALSLDGINVTDGESAIIAELDEMADATVKLLSDEGLRRRLSQRGRQLVESEYTWQRTASRYEQLYAEIRRV